MRRPGLRPRWSPTDREIISLAVPALATLVAEPLYVLTDTAVVGHLGTDRLAGLAVASQILVTAYALSIFLAYGTTSSIGRLMGAGRRREGTAQAVQGMWLALCLGIAVAAGLLVGGGALVDLLGATGAVRDHALLYLRISVAGLPALFLSLAGVGYFRGLKDTRTPFVVALLTSVVNLVVELVLIFGLGFDLGASALATVLAQWLGAGVFVTRVRSGARREGVSGRPDWIAVRRLLVVGTHLLVRTAALRGALLVGVAAATRHGAAEVAAYEVGFAVWSLLALALDSLAIAAQPLVAESLGRDDPVSAQAVGARVSRWGVGVGALLGAVVFAGREPLAGIFSGDPSVEGLAAMSLAWVALTQPLNGWVFALDGVLIGAGDQKYLAKAMVGALAVFVVPAVAVAWLRPGLAWVWAALTLLMVARLVALQRRFAGGRWAVGGATRR